MSNQEPHVSAQARCFLCDHDLSPIKGRDPRGVALFTIGGSIEVIRDAFSNIDRFVRHEGNYICYVVRGVRHCFSRLHPKLVVNFVKTLWDDVPLHAGEKDCGQCIPEKSLFFAHAGCWAIAEQCGISTTQLYQFAAQTQPLVPWQGAKLHSRLLGLPGCSNSEPRTPLAGLLDAISRRLPLELQQIIMESLQRSAMDDAQVASRASGEDETVAESSGALFTQLAVVQSHTVPALQQIRTGNGLNCHASRSSVAITKGDSQARTLSIRVQNIFGRAYISEIGINQLGKGVLPLPISANRITGLRFALGRFGLRAVRILYEGGSHSAWLGEPSGCWFGNLRGSDLRSLHTTGDRLRVTTLDFDCEPRRAHGIRHALLDHEVDATPGEPLASTCNYVSAQPPVLTTRLYPKWRIISCLPLTFGASYATGITIHWQARIIIGMTSYGPNGQIVSLGQCRGESRHFPLMAGEYFTSFWIRPTMEGNLAFQPFVLSFTTSLGRSCHFGPHHMVRARTNLCFRDHPWEKISNWLSRVKITEILVDACNDSNQDGYHNFGVVEVPDPSMEKVREPVPTMEPLEREALGSSDCFPLHHLTTGSLHDVVALQVRRNQDRFVGMRICHSSGLDDYPGSWDPQDTAHIMTLFDVSEGRLVGVRFDLAEGKYGLFVSEISAPIDPPSPAHRDWQLSLSPALPTTTMIFHSDVPNERLAWWSDDYCDEIRSYEPGPLVDIPSTEKNKQVALLWEPPDPGSHYRL